MTELEEKIEIVKNDMLQRFPNCSYTIRILLWYDNTNVVECRHGTACKDGYADKLHISQLYNDILKYDIINIRHQVGGIMVDEEGTEYYRKELKND